MLALMLATVIVGCGGSKPSRQEAIARYGQQLREAVSTNVADEQRRNQMLGILDELDAVNRRFTQETVDFVASYRQLNVDYDATRASFDRLFSDYSAKRITARDETLDLHFRLAALATTEEWRAIAKAESELFEEVTAARPAQESTP